MKGYPELLQAIMAWDPPVHIFGGIAEDALLHGRFSRPHDDVDVMVYRDELDWRIERARALGFDRWHLRMESRPGVPLVVGAIEGGLNLEFVVFDRDASGRVWFEIPVPDGLARVTLPPGSFDHPESEIEGVRVRTFSPLALYHLRAAVAETFGGFRAKDEVSQAALRARFLADLPEAALAPLKERVTPRADRPRAARAASPRRSAAGRA